MPAAVVARAHDVAMLNSEELCTELVLSITSDH